MSGAATPPIVNCVPKCAARSPAAIGTPRPEPNRVMISPGAMGPGSAEPALTIAAIWGGRAGDAVA